MVVEARSETADLEEAREKLIQSFSGLDEALLGRPDVIGEWSVKACLAHIIAWDEWVESALEALDAEQTVDWPTEHAMNDAAPSRWTSLGIEELVRTLRAGRGLIVGRLAAMTDEERAEPHYTIGEKTISADDFIDGFIEHDLEHAGQIRAWRKAQDCIDCME